MIGTSSGVCFEVPFEIMGLSGGDGDPSDPTKVCLDLTELTELTKVLEVLFELFRRVGLGDGVLDKTRVGIRLGVGGLSSS